MLNINFGSFPVLATPRLILRQQALTDAPVLYRIRSDENVMRYIGRPIAKTTAEMEALITLTNENFTNNNGVTWAITLAGKDEMIGMIGFHQIDKEHHRAVVGYLLLPAHHRAGIMHEALGAVLRYGFEELHLHSVEANVDDNNIASIRLLEKFNFRREAHFRENYYFEGRFLDSVIYSLIRPTP